MSLVTYWLAAGEGKTVSFRPRGSSMRGLVEDGDLVEVAPCVPERLRTGDVVLARVAGHVYLHKVVATGPGQVQIGNNRGRVNGWARHAAVTGICISVNGRPRPELAGKVAPTPAPDDPGAGGAGGGAEGRGHGGR